jgi:hypothetical protein
MNIDNRNGASKAARFRVRFMIVGTTDQTQTVTGQEARTLLALHAAGPAGITALEISTWALRLSHYIFKLRGRGLSIDMEREEHAGPVSGVHGRYRLQTPIEFVPFLGMQEAA